MHGEAGWLPELLRHVCLEVEMQTLFTFRQFEANDELKTLIASKIDKRLGKLVDSEGAECRVILSMEKAWVTVDLSVTAFGEVFKCAEKTLADLHPTIDLVLDKVERQLLKRKEMVQDRRTRRA